MKKNILIFVAFLFTILAIFSGNLFAETAESMQAGVAAAVKGEVSAMTPSAKAAHPLRSGDKIFMGDKIETGADSQLQILLLDETVFTLGPLSTITVDEFLYDPGNTEDKASLVKGVFRAVSGKVAGKKQENAAETEALLNSLDELDQKSEEAAQDRAQSSEGSIRR
ncbi:MAG: FecR domain-containing protein [Candidatus Omnitrophica bacterium]|nr:FecR domain-containing protein [Candidatus Omnitrophota bacterium]